MLDFIVEKQDVWDRLRASDRPIVLYGMGDGADKILAVFGRYGITVSAVFASDEFVRGQSFRDFTVERYRDIQARYKDFIIVVCFGTATPETLAFIHELNRRHPVVAPDVPVAGEGLFTYAYAMENYKKLVWVYNRLADSQSRVVFRNMINYKISGKLCYLWESETSREEAYRSLLRLNESESYVDVGAYRGDTIEEFLRYTGGCYRQITALEPDRRSFKKLTEMVDRLRLPRVSCHSIAAHSKDGTLRFQARGGRNSSVGNASDVIIKARTVDTILDGRPVSYMNFDVEGMEQDALMGSAATIARFRPRLWVSAYHRNEDLFALPLFISRLYGNYRFHLRHFPCVPGWDTCYICIDGRADEKNYESCCYFMKSGL